MYGEKLIGFVRRAMVAGFVLLLSSCFETEDEFTLNPDGTGKVKHECTFQKIDLMGEGEALTEEGVKEAVAEVLKNSKGVEAWKDVSYKLLDDGRIWFQGTAYFEDLADLDIQNQGLLKFAWKRSDAGEAELVLQMNEQEEPAGKEKELSAEEQAKKVKSERAKFQQSKPMLAAILGGMNHEVRFNLPGEVKERSNFTSEADGQLGIEFSGARMLEVLETLMADDSWLASQGFKTDKGPEFDEKTCGLLFGEEAPVRVKLSGADAPLFDYAAELAVAKKETVELQKKLGTAGIVPAGKGEPLKHVRVVGVRLIQELDKKLNLRPFNYDAGLSLSVLAELSGSALDFTDECRIEKAIANDGSSLLKSDKDWDRRISFPKLSEDKASVLFEINLKLPPAEVSVIKELSGVLEYRVAGATKEVDLGLTSFTEGSKGVQLNVEIKSVDEPNSDDGSQQFGLKLKIRPDDLVEAFVVIDGERKPLKRRGYGSSGGSTNFSFSSEDPLSEAESIIIVTHDELETFQVPFELKNLSLTGAALDH